MAARAKLTIEFSPSKEALPALADIFISYASEDRSRVKLLAEALSRQGCSVWWDRTIPAGKSFVEVIEEGSDTVVASGYLVMPHLGADAWGLWRDSSFVRADLRSDRTYRIVIRSDPSAMNMSELAHFEQYTAGLGGSGGAFNRVNIAELKVLSLVGG